MIEFNHDQKMMMINSIAEAILENTNITAQSADKIARAILRYQDIEISEDDTDNRHQTNFPI